MVEQISLVHMPLELAVYAALYRDLQNAKFLREQLLAGNSDFEYAFVDASMVLSRNQILSAVFRAMNDYLHDRLKSRNVHSETVFALSPNNNIGEAFRRFGISDETKDLIVIKIATTPQVTLEKVQEHLGASIKGEEVPLTDEALSTSCDTARIRKIYKAPAASKTKSTNGVHPSQQEQSQLGTQVLGAMALRGAT